MPIPDIPENIMKSSLPARYTAQPSYFLILLPPISPIFLTGIFFGVLILLLEQEKKNER
jgi:hypothetical protein